MEEAEDGIESKGAAPKNVLQQVSDKGRTFSYQPSPSAPRPSGIGPTVGKSSEALPKETANDNLRLQRAAEDNKHLQTNAGINPRALGADEGNKRRQQFSNSKGSTPVGKAVYKLHLASLKIAKKIRKETDKLIPEKVGAMVVGLLTHDGLSIVRGDEAKHKPLVSLAEALISRASPEIKDFKFTALAIT